MPQSSTLLLVFFLFGSSCLGHVNSEERVSYELQIAPLFLKHCGGCHNDTDKEGAFTITSYSALMKGTPKKVVVLQSDPSKSPLLQMLKGSLEPKMPPAEEPQLTQDQIQIVERWIAEGARGSDKVVPLKDRLKTPTIETKKGAYKPISAMAWVARDDVRSAEAVSGIGNHATGYLAIGTTGSVSLRPYSDKEGAEILRSSDPVGKVAQLRSSSDGKWLVSASGVSGLGGQVTLLDSRSLSTIRQIECSGDTLYSAVISPNGKLVAAAGYDRSIHLFNLESGEKIRTLEGHNAAIYDLDFDPSGVLLASASGDETVKIWRVDTGERMDTLGQGEGEQYSVRFSPDGNWLAAAGADRRIRMWKVVSRESASINPMVHSVFAHEGSVLAISYSNDGRRIASAGEDKKIKLWSAPGMEPLGELASLKDIPTAIVMDTKSETIFVSSMDGQVSQLAMAKMVDSNIRTDSLKARVESLVEPGKELTMHQAVETEFNSTYEKAEWHPIPAKVSGVIGGDMDEDWFAFDAKAGESWILRVAASVNKSPLDSRIEIYDTEGKSLLRTRLQAVRESYFTFRGKSSDVVDDFRLHRWEDMELNEWLYSGGEVVKLWLYPRGPDSGFKVYPGFGSRHTYFDTTPTTHALGETAWIVRELKKDEDPIPNGLPIFPIYYENDDDGERRLGRDSKIHFTAPRTDRFLVRIRDARGESGENYKYELSIVPPKPDFSISCNVGELPVAVGSGREFEVTAIREDGFAGPIQVRLEGLPPGFVATQPLIVEAGQHKALGTIHWTREVPEETSAEFDLQVVGSASLASGVLERKTPKPIHIKRVAGERVSFQVFTNDGKEPVSAATGLTLRAGGSVSAKVVADRGKFLGDIGFGTDDSGRNIPHGVIVGNIGLSGLLIPAGQTQQELVLVAAPWVEPQERLFHLRANIDGNPTTVPILLKIVK